MKPRTKAILAAADAPRLLALRSGVCDAIYTNSCFAAYDEWFAKWFSPLNGGRGIDGWVAYWLGDFTPANLELRWTFIAFAAAVSETEP